MTAGSQPGSLIASWALSKVFPQETPTPKKITKKILSKALGKKIGKKIAYKIIGTTTVGRIAGRFVSALGWGLLARDAWVNRDTIAEFIEEVKETNETNKSNLLWHVR